MALTDECADADGSTGAAEAGAAGCVAGALATLCTLAVLLAVPPWLSVVAYTPAATIAKRATSVIAPAIRPVRKLISSSWALTAARRPHWARIPWYPPTFTACDDTDKRGR